MAENYKEGAKMKILENIIHPQVQKNCALFLQENRKKNAKIVLLNIPLLLEKKGYKCDKIISLIISPSVQKRRFIARQKKLFKNLSKQEIAQKFIQISAQQFSNLQRKKMSNFVINSSFSKEKTIAQAKNIFQKIIK